MMTDSAEMKRAIQNQAAALIVEMRKAIFDWQIDDISDWDVITRNG